jgi:hypothetical protein
MSDPRIETQARIAAPRLDPDARPVEVRERRYGWPLSATIVVLLLCGILLFAYGSGPKPVANPDGTVSTTGQSTHPNVHPAVPPRQITPDGVPTPRPAGPPATGAPGGMPPGGPTGGPPASGAPAGRM